MSAGYVHRKASLILASGFLLGGIFSLNHLMLYDVFGALLGIIFTPDLDVDNGFIGDAIIRKKLGSFAEKIWDSLWYWYRRSLKHGSPLSHMPVIGTLGRIAYIFLILIVIPHSLFYYIFKPSWDLIYVLSLWVKNIMYYDRIIIALIASDTIHWALDICTTEHKDSK